MTMRISKEPEERKQEILETAMRLFSVNGFEKTSISDIAKEIGVAQGLCYRYFPSKDVLFQSAISEYADSLINKMLESTDIKNDTLCAVIDKMKILVEDNEDVYYPVFHAELNDNFHKLLTVTICEKLFPIVSSIIERANFNQEIHIANEDIETYASFCVYGQLGILLNTDYSVQEKNDRIKRFLKELFKL